MFRRKALWNVVSLCVTWQRAGHSYFSLCQWFLFHMLICSLFVRLLGLILYSLASVLTVVSRRERKWAGIRKSNVDFIWT